MCDDSSRVCNNHFARDVNEDPLACRFALCGGTALDTFGVNSPCASAPGCKACLPESTAAWHCYKEIELPYGFTCPAGRVWDATTLNDVWVSFCGPLTAASPSVSITVSRDSFLGIAAGKKLLAELDILVQSNGLSFDKSDPCQWKLSLTPPLTQLVQGYLAALFVLALPTSGVTENAFSVKLLTLLVCVGKRQSADFNVQLQFSLLKGDDLAASDLLVQQFVSALVQGVVPGVDPISVDYTPASTPVFPAPGGVNVTTAPPTEIVKPRDPTSSLNGGALFGIIFGASLALIAVAAGFAYCFIKYRGRRQAPFEPSRATL